MTLADILRAGKANIERRGWAQGDVAVFCGPPDGPCCVATSLPKLGDDYDRSLLAIDLFKQINNIDPMIGIGEWNDDPARTKEEVLTAFDKAIALAEQENT